MPKNTAIKLIIAHPINEATKRTGPARIKNSDLLPGSFNRSKITPTGVPKIIAINPNKDVTTSNNFIKADKTTIASIYLTFLSMFSAILPTTGATQRSPCQDL